MNTKCAGRRSLGSGAFSLAAAVAVASATAALLLLPASVCAAGGDSGGSAAHSEAAGGSEHGAGGSEHAGKSDSTHAAADKASITEFFETVRKIGAHHPYSIGTIEKITGRSLHPESVAVFASDPVEGRVLNHVDAPHGQDGKLTAVTLVVGSEPRISLSEVEMELGHHISVDKHPSVHEPANESPVVYKFNHHGLNIDGEFEDDQKNGHAEYLRAVTLF